MSRTPCFSSFFGIGSMPHSGMPGPPMRPGVAQHEHVVRRDVEVVVVDRRLHRRIVVEDERRPGVLAEAAARRRSA